MKLAAPAFAVALQRALFEHAMKCQGSIQDSVLLAAAKLERGEKAPHWIADRFVPLAGQDAYGTVWMMLPVREQAEIVDQFVS